MTTQMLIKLNWSSSPWQIWEDQVKTMTLDDKTHYLSVPLWEPAWQFGSCHSYTECSCFVDGENWKFYTPVSRGMKKKKFTRQIIQLTFIWGLCQFFKRPYFWIIITWKEPLPPLDEDNPHYWLFTLEPQERLSTSDPFGSMISL